MEKESKDDVGGAEVTSDLKEGEQIGELDANPDAEYIEAYPQGAKFEAAADAYLGDGELETIPEYYDHLNSGNVSEILTGSPPRTTGYTTENLVSENGDSLTVITSDPSGTPVDTVTLIPLRENRGLFTSQKAVTVQKIKEIIVNQIRQ